MQLFYEYAKTSGILHGKPNNGKSIMRGGRKHQNLIAKEYQHKEPIVNKIVAGKANKVHISGTPLMNILRNYDTEFEIGTKVLGNSGCMITMFTDQTGAKRAILSNRKKQNGLQRK